MRALGLSLAAMSPAAVLALLAGCAGSPAPATAGHPSTGRADLAPFSSAEPAPSAINVSNSTTAGRLMVTLPPAPPALWSRTTAELEQTYRLRTIFSWTMESLGEQCIVFERKAR